MSIVSRLAVGAFGLVLAATPVAAFAAGGQSLFMDNCATCHQPNGVGDPKEPITRVLKGRGGMPSFASELSDLEIATVLTYVRSAWGNKAGPVQPTQIAAMRSTGRRDNAKASLLAH